MTDRPAVDALRYVGRKTLRKLQGRSNENLTAAPDAESFGRAMMEKLGWKEGSGIGKNQDGIDAPLVVKKDGRDTGRIIKSKALFSSEKNEIEDELPPDKAQSR